MTNSDEIHNATGDLETPLLDPAEPDEVVDDPDPETETEPLSRVATSASPPELPWWRQPDTQHSMSMVILLVVALVWVVVIWVDIRHTASHNENSTNSSISFPALTDTLNMAALSQLVYAFHSSSESSEDICRRINQRNLTVEDQQRLWEHEKGGLHHTMTWNPENVTGAYDAYMRPHIPGDVQCHWYHHDWWGGTQVLLMESEEENYVAIVYGGTDDIRTSLTDANVLSTTYGIASNGTQVLPTVDETIRVHAGFDHAVFDHGLFSELRHLLDSVLTANPDRRLFTTGHSLGAADAILTSLGLPYPSTSINFGCPRTGNEPWRDWVNLHRRNDVTVWRCVLGRDLVPRLPALFQHVGHTVQFTEEEASSASASNATTTTTAYYHHWGNATLGYAGVPSGWSATPYVWVPGALLSHRMTRYRKFLAETREWIEDFEHSDDQPAPVMEDDDFYDEPPDDDDSVAGAMEGLWQEGLTE